MLKLTKKADYGLIALKHLADSGSDVALSAKDIAEAHHLPQEALAKILQRLAKAGLLVSQHGTNGGYVLARSPKQITTFEVIKAIDGPLFITACNTHKGACHQSTHCGVKEPLQRLSDGIRELLVRMTVADMQEPAGTQPRDAGRSHRERTAASELVTLA